MAEQDKREKVVQGLKWCMNEEHDCYREKGCPYENEGEDVGCKYALHRDALELLKAQEHPDFSGSFLNRDDYVRIGDVMDCLSEVFVPKDDLIHIEGLIEWAMGKRAISKEELLKAQEPRIMTLEELAEWHNIPESKRDPIYVEYLPNSGLGISHWTTEYFGFNPNSYPNKDSGYYEKWLRCWTSRPTDEQREAVEWEGSSNL